jgi:Protein of unknown function (DUF1460)
MIYTKKAARLGGFFCVFLVQIGFGQSNEAIFNQKMKLPLAPKKPEMIITLAQSFVGQPYQAATLEATPEQLVVNLQEFDCFTFVESVVALAECQKKNGNYADYQSILLKLRYRNGGLNGYGSRLHYFLEWINQNQLSFKNITNDLGGEAIQKKIDYITTHRNAYKNLKTAQDFRQITKSEEQLSDLKWHWIPKTKIKIIEKKLQNGDIVAFTSAVAGLDFNHEGFVIIKNQKAYLVHASTDRKKVIVATETIADYAQRIKKHSGIVVLRMVD